MAQWSVPGYVEERPLGKGATGRVVAAVHAASGQRVAIKYLSDGLMRNQAFVTRFRAEAGVLRSLAVPQVVQLVGYAEEPGRGAAIIMELVQGVSLHQMISKQGPASPEAALVVLKGSLLGLAAAHSLGIVHRDYKPENVLVDAEGTSKLADFGVAARAGKSAPAEGTPLYMAPEQWLGAPATPASDIYAATAVFFECLTGRAPFPGPIGKLEQQHAYAAVPVEQVAEPLRPLIERGMAKNPAYRPSHAFAFVTELEATASGTYGPDWEARGRDRLREAAALLLLLGSETVAAGSGLAQVKSWLGAHQATAIGAAALAVAAVAGGAVAATALTGPGSPGPHAQASSGHPTPSAAGSATTSATPTPSATPTVSASPSASVTPSASASPSTSGTANGNGNGTGNGNGGGTGTTTPPPPTITVTLASDPSSPASWMCGTTAPAFTITGQITSDQAATVTYQWSRSDGTSSAPMTVAVTAGVASPVTDTLTAGQGSWSLTDTLEITSPDTSSKPITVMSTCTYPQPSISTGSLPSGTYGYAYSAQLSAAGGDGTYQWSASGLPDGLSLDPASGAISGTPKTTGTFTVTITVTDGEATPQTASVALSLTIYSPIQ